jgi:hypothetical protein
MEGSHMKRLAALLAVTCVAAAFVAPADAAKKKKAKTFKHTIYLHGTQQAGEAEIPDAWLSDLWMNMDAEKPGSGAPKSMFVTNYVGGPNTNCSGNGLLPVWQGAMKGTVKGNVTLELHTVASPAASLEARLYPDASGGCNESAAPPAASAIVEVAPGQSVTKVTFKKVNFKVLSRMVLQLNMAGAPTPGQVRVLYDSDTAASSVSFTCIKKKCL